MIINHKKSLIIFKAAVAFIILFKTVSAFSETPVVNELNFKKYGFSENSLSHKEKFIYSERILEIKLTMTSPEHRLNAVVSKTRGRNTYNIRDIKKSGSEYTLTVVPLSEEQSGIYHLEIYPVHIEKGPVEPVVLIYVVFFGMKSSSFIEGAVSDFNDTTTSVSGKNIQIKYKRVKGFTAERFSHGKQEINAKGDVLIKIPYNRDMDYYIEGYYSIFDSITGIDHRMFAFFAGDTVSQYHRWLKQYRDENFVYFSFSPPREGRYLLEIYTRYKEALMFDNFIHYKINIAEGSGKEPAFDVSDSSDSELNNKYDYSVIDRFAENLDDKSHNGLKSLAQRLIVNAKNDREKARAIFTWLETHMKYDIYMLQDGFIGYLKRRGKCSTFSEMFYFMCFEAGLLCEIDTNRVFDIRANSWTEMHAWNRVLVDGKWQLIDSTWAGVNRSRWFFTDPQFFFETHEIKYPGLWKVDTGKYKYSK